jgi:hypothetical protein
MTFDTTTLVLHLRIVGAMLACLAFMNLFVPRYFRWREDMAGLSLVNRQIFQVHGFFIIVILVLFSALLLTCSDALVDGTRLSRAVLVGLTVFWGLRLLMQWGFYSWDLWRGNRFNTAMHFLFSAAWLYMTTTFASALWMNLSRME